MSSLKTLLPMSSRMITIIMVMIRTMMMTWAGLLSMIMMKMVMKKGMKMRTITLISTSQMESVLRNITIDETDKRGKM